MTDKERLDYLLRSETIRLVDERKFTPEDLDNTLQNLRHTVARQAKDNEALQYQHFLELSEKVRLRRLVEFLMGHDNPDVGEGA